MSFFGKLFHDIGHAFKDVFHAISHALDQLVKGLKEIADGLTGILKTIMDSVIKLAEALATGNLQKIGQRFAELGMAMANAPGDIAGTVVGSAVKLVGGLAADALGVEPPAWLKTVANAASIASHLVNPESALAYAEKQVASVALGGKTDVENLVSGIKNDVHHTPHTV
jgi:hypothetical protein